MILIDRSTLDINIYFNQRKVKNDALCGADKTMEVPYVDFDSVVSTQSKMMYNLN
jgi:hypothetical protein